MSSQIPEFESDKEHIAELYRRIDVLHDRLRSIEPLLVLLYRATSHQDHTAAIARQAYESMQQTETNPNNLYFLKLFVETIVQTQPHSDADQPAEPAGNGHNG